MKSGYFLDMILIFSYKWGIDQWEYLASLQEMLERKDSGERRGERI
jgi:hypothetical protein